MFPHAITFLSLDGGSDPSPSPTPTPTVTPGTAGAVRGVGSGRCLDVSGVSQANGAQVQIWDCNGGSNQKWRLNSDGTITAVAANKFLDVPNSATANGTKLAIWSCNGGGNQRWTRT